MTLKQHRRIFLKSTAIGGAAALVGARSQEGHAKPSPSEGTKMEYPVFHIASTTQLQDESAMVFHYPDKESPCLLIKAGGMVPGGIGPTRNIVAYSAMCTHMGCFVSYDPSTQTIKCPCHFSVFDPENRGQMVCGQATENLPQIQLTLNERNGSISAVGVHGQLYGRVSNLL